VDLPVDTDIVAPARPTTADPSPLSPFDLAGVLVATLAVELARGLREVAVRGAITDATQARGGDLLRQLFFLRQECPDAVEFDRSARAHGAELMRACARADVTDQTISELVQAVFDLLTKVVRAVVN